MMHEEDVVHDVIVILMCACIGFMSRLLWCLILH